RDRLSRRATLRIANGRHVFVLDSVSTYIPLADGRRLPGMRPTLLAGDRPMYFKQFLDERCGCASYVVASRQSHEAAIVDPSIDTEQYAALLSQRDCRLPSELRTHVHA